MKLRKSELKAGYMKDADYRRKTEEVAKAKREALALAETVSRERSFYANEVNVTLQLAQKQLIGDQKALAELAQTDPHSWVIENAKFQERAQEFNQLVQQSQAIASQQTAEQERQHAEWVEAERKALSTALPEWRDKAKAADEQKLIAEYLIEKGYTADELATLQDHRALLIARDAAQFAQLKAAKAKQTKQEPPKVMRPGASVPKPEQGKSRAEELLRVAKRTHSPDASVNWLLARQGK
ncbi:MAG TPA: hypothetical protein VEY92_08400 [Pseudoxanthomonas sp.]|nr:hypothetical protein [Pseudoxanthomonas sp.]